MRRLYEQDEEAKEAFVLHARRDEEDVASWSVSGETLILLFDKKNCTTTSDANPSRTSHRPKQRVGRALPIHHHPNH